MATLKSMYNEQCVTDFAAAIKAAYPEFDQAAFIAGVLDDNWENRELKERTRHISHTLHDFLPAGYRAALAVLGRAAPLLANYGFQNMVFADYVEAYGLDDWEASIPALEQFTHLASAEFAIRPFIVRYPEQTMAQMVEWSKSDDVDLRRLASEGCRPRLPWGIALPVFKADPFPILPILERLKDDESENVRNSVANNLNDISKDNPQVVLKLLQRWQAIETEEMQWITRHALRTLIKQGHPAALELLGYPTHPAIVVHNLVLDPTVVPPEGTITFSFDIESLADKAQNLMIDFVLYLMRANGKQTPKVFKLTTKTIRPGETLHILKSYSFKPVTTRKYYAGAHAIEPQINGHKVGRVEFVLG
ncbi:MAG: DNA alkylation repair protein [Anaerolineae bacterium]|nr:DNA alkylation repair protein [Anaerolineae bacterium]